MGDSDGGFGEEERPDPTVECFRIINQVYYYYYFFFFFFFFYFYFYFYFFYFFFIFKIFILFYFLFFFFYTLNNNNNNYPRNYGLGGLSTQQKETGVTQAWHEWTFPNMFVYIFIICI